MSKGLRLLREMLAFQSACERLGEISTDDLIFVATAAVLREIARTATASALTCDEIVAEIRKE